MIIFCRYSDNFLSFQRKSNLEGSKLQFAYIQTAVFLCSNESLALFKLLQTENSFCRCIVFVHEKCAYFKISLYLRGCTPMPEALGRDGGGQTYTLKA